MKIPKKKEYIFSKKLPIFALRNNVKNDNMINLTTLTPKSYVDPTYQRPHLTPQGWLKDGSVLIRDGKILEVTNCDLAVIGAQLIDVKGMYVLPGGVEIHAHGGGGRDFMECTEDAFRAAVKTHMKYGTTSIFPTLSSSTVPMIEQAAETCTKLMEEKDSPILGLHLEGHYLNMAMAGGQIPENIKSPDPNEYIPIVETWSCIKRWDAAPELPGAMQFGKYITAKGILASVAHTQAEFEDIRTAYEAGYTHATHFYNANARFPQTPRVQIRRHGRKHLSAGRHDGGSGGRRHPCPSHHPATGLQDKRRRTHLPDNRRPGMCRKRQPGSL